MKDYNLNVNLGVAFKISIPKVEEGEIKKKKNSMKVNSHWAIEQVLGIHHLSIIPGGVFYRCFKLGDFMTAAVYVI